MARPIPLQLADPVRIEVDGALVARGLGLAPAEFRRLMEAGRVRVLCERGVGEDAGLFRASFYHGDRRVRLVLDAEGRLVAGAPDAPDSTPPSRPPKAAAAHHGRPVRPHGDSA